MIYANLSFPKVIWKLGLPYLPLLCVIVMSFLQLSIAAQSIVVNADGTHSVIIENIGGTSLMVNPNGSHTMIIDHGSTKTLVNSDGTNSVMMNANTNMPLLVNPDGSHTVILNAHSNMPVIVNIDGTHTQIMKNGNTEIHINPDGKNSIYPVSTHDPTKTSKKDTIHRKKKKQNLN